MSNISDKWISKEYQSRYSFVLKIVTASVVLGTVIAKALEFAATTSDWGTVMQTTALQLFGAVCFRHCIVCLF